MDGLKAAMVHSSLLRIARYLMRNVPEHFSGIDDEFLRGPRLPAKRLPMSSASKPGVAGRAWPM
jgi:hypothetical protein